MAGFPEPSTARRRDGHLWREGIDNGLELPQRGLLFLGQLAKRQDLGFLPRFSCQFIELVDPLAGAHPDLEAYVATSCSERPALFN